MGNNSMKTRYLFVVTLALTATLAGCSDGKTPADLHKQEKKPEQKQEKKPEVVKSKSQSGKKSMQISSADAEKFALLKKPTNPRDKVVRIISEQLEMNVRQIKPESSFVEDLGMDDLGQAKLLMKIEKEFKISISEDDSESLTTVRKLLDFVENQL